MTAPPAHGAPARRRGRLVELLEERGCDAILVTQPLNLRYVTGFTGSHGALLLASDGTSRMVTDGRYAEQVGTEAPGLEVEITTEPPVKVLAAEALRRGSKCVVGE